MKLLVCTNPYFATDYHGCPAGAVHREFIKGSNGKWFRATEYLGARRAPPKLERDAPSGPPEVGRLRKPRFHVRFVFDKEPFEVDATYYNKRQVHEEALIAADVATAKACRVEFVEPETVRSVWRARKGGDVDPLWKQ